VGWAARKLNGRRRDIGGPRMKKKFLKKRMKKEEEKKEKELKKIIKNETAPMSSSTLECAFWTVTG